MRHAGPGEAERVADVDSQNLLPVLVGELQDHLVPQDVGIVHDDVDSPRLLDGPRHNRLQLGGAAHVGRDAATAQFGDRLGQLVGVEVDEEHVGAARLEQPGDFESDAPGDAGDDGGAVGDLIAEVPMSAAFP